jgi:hypothetical protein
MLASQAVLKDDRALLSRRTLHQSKLNTPYNDEPVESTCLGRRELSVWAASKALLTAGDHNLGPTEGHQCNAENTQGNLCEVLGRRPGHDDLPEL